MKNIFTQTSTNGHQATLSSLFIFLFTTFIISSCQKEPLTANNELQATTAEKTASPKAQPDIIVSAGSSIQDAVDAAAEGSAILIEPGTYNEAIVINKPGIKLIGKNTGNKEVLIENPGDEENGITVNDAGDDFTLMNVTVKGFKENGVYLTQVNKYLLSHVTAINNGEYGLFPQFCQNGVIEYCTASGHSDTGIYIGQSSDGELRNNTAFANVNGIEVENCTNVTVTKNDSYNNVVGILVVLLPGLPVKESSGIIVSQNHVTNNNHSNFANPEEGFESSVPSGSGILIVGTDNALVESNIVMDNNFVGIAVVTTLILGALTDPPLPPEAFADIEPFSDNVKVVKNVVMKNGANPPEGMPLPGVDLLWDGTGTGNCWSKNNFKTSFPEALPSCY